MSDDAFFAPESQVDSSTPVHQTTSEPPPRPTDDHLDAALEWLRLGYWPVAIHPKDVLIGGTLKKGKEPIGDKWGLTRWSEDKLRKKFAANLGAGIGICFGPGRAPDGRWLIDLECDSEAAVLSLAIVLGLSLDVLTLCWMSRRGRHLIFALDEADALRLLELLTRAGAKEGKGNRVGVWHLDALPGLEWRIGGYKADGAVKQVQSVVPPTRGEDGVPRAWEVGPDIPVATLPANVLDVLEGLAELVEERQAIQVVERDPAPVASRQAGATGRNGQLQGGSLRSYVTAALARECDIVKAIEPGERNNRLNVAAFKLGSLIGPDKLSRSEIESGLAYAAEKANLPASEAARTIKSGLDAGERLPRDLSHVGTGRKKPSANGDGRQRRDDGKPAYLPEIICGSEEPEEGLKKWTPAAIDALRLANRRNIEIFQHDGVLCRVKPGDIDGPPTIEPFHADSLRGALDRAAHWGAAYRSKKGEARVKWGPPRLDIVRDLLAMVSYDQALFPPIDLIAEFPRFLPDGKLVLTPGYHREGRFYYTPAADLAGLDIPTDPTSHQVEAARALILDELLVDFPFANQASKANALAATLLPFVREMIEGPTPPHHFEASTEGTGKGLCVAACAFPALGREIDLNPQKESEAEWRKALTSAFVSGGSHFLIDNMYNPLGWDNTPMPVDSGTLAAAWTVRYWRDRLLGGNHEVRVRVQTVFMSTGNNVMFSRELDRRLVRIELMATCENPSLRTGFKHDPLLDWARENRQALTVACLTLCRRWIADGMPPGKEVAGSYANYARVMGGILGACKVEKFLANGLRKIARNPEAERWNMLISEWMRIHGQRLVSTGQLHTLILGQDGLSERFHELLGDGSELSQRQKLGKALDRIEGRVCGQWRIVRSETSTANKTALWKLQDPKIRHDAENQDEDESCDTFLATSMHPL
jgi:hypothetical protein